MSEELKKKLYNYESIPPEKTWDKISAALDEELSAKFPKKLYDLEMVPPQQAWASIAASLDNAGPDQFAIRLKELDVNPPSSVWSKIELALNESGTGRPAPVRRIPALIKYAVAACLVGALAFGVFKLLSPAVDKTTARVTFPSRDTAQSSTIDKTNNLSAQIPEEPKAMLASAVASNHLPKRKISAQETGYMTQLVTPSLVDMNANYSCSFQDASLRGEVPGNCSSIADADPYLMFINPDGYLIRISKKLAETLGCLYTSARATQLNDCQDQIKKWRDKIAQSPASSSPDNFMNILDIIRSIRD